MPPTREIQQVTFQNGIILGYSNREHEIPDGFCAEAHNVLINSDGSIAARPGLLVVEASDSPTVVWDHVLNDVRRIYWDGTDIKVSTRSGIARATSITGSIGGGPGLAYSIVGQHSTYGTDMVIPFVEPNPTLTTFPLTIGTPVPNRISDVYVVITDTVDGNSVIVNPVPATVVDLATLLNHTVVTEPLSATSTAGQVFARLTSHSWKSRIFVVAGTQVSYSAVGQPAEFSPANGAGSFNLDTDSQSVGSFILNDNLYIITRKEVFVFNYSTDPGTDGELRSIAKVNGLGAAEYDNIGYIAVREGLFRVSNGQLQPTYIPSSESHMGYQTYGVDEEGVVTKRIELPRHTSISKVGDQIILSGIGTSLLSIEEDAEPYTLVFSTQTEGWVTWSASTTNVLGTPSTLESPCRWFNLTGPLTRIIAGGIIGSEQYVGTNIEFRSSSTETRQLSHIVVAVEDATTEADAATPVTNRRWMDLWMDYGAAIADASNIFEINPTLKTGFLQFGDPLSHKRCHRLWMTGKFFPHDRGAPARDNTRIRLRIFNGPNDDIDIVNYNDYEDSDRVISSRFDISAYQISQGNAFRFEKLFFEVGFKFIGDLLDDPFDDSQQYMDLAISALYFDISRASLTNRGF